jgi:hypothetical protein
MSRELDVWNKRAVRGEVEGGMGGGFGGRVSTEAGARGVGEAGRRLKMRRAADAQDVKCTEMHFMYFK